MGKAGRKRRHSAKMERKRNAKAQRRSAYAALAGTSKKLKNKKKQIRISSSAKHAHRMANCGNAGCTRCNPLKVPLQHGYVCLGHRHTLA